MNVPPEKQIILYVDLMPIALTLNQRYTELIPCGDIFSENCQKHFLYIYCTKFSLLLTLAFYKWLKSALTADLIEQFDQNLYTLNVGREEKRLFLMQFR